MPQILKPGLPNQRVRDPFNFVYWDKFYKYCITLYKFTTVKAAQCDHFRPDQK